MPSRCRPPIPRCRGRRTPASSRRYLVAIAGYFESVRRRVLQRWRDGAKGRERAGQRRDDEAPGSSVSTDARARRRLYPSRANARALVVAVSGANHPLSATPCYTINAHVIHRAVTGAAAAVRLPTLRPRTPGLPVHPRPQSHRPVRRVLVADAESPALGRATGRHLHGYLTSSVRRRGSGRGRGVREGSKRAEARDRRWLSGSRRGLSRVDAGDAQGQEAAGDWQWPRQHADSRRASAATT